MGITLYSHFILAGIDYFFFAFLDFFPHPLLKQLVRQRCSLHSQTQNKINPNPFSPDPSKFLHLCPRKMQLLNTFSNRHQELSLVNCRNSNAVSLWLLRTHHHRQLPPQLLPRA